MPERLIAIGDIHGCSAALEALLGAIKPGPGDTIVTLGDYVDRGPDSRGVIEKLVRLSAQTHLVSLLGNHDKMMLDAFENTSDAIDRGRLLSETEEWLMCGGDATLASYGTNSPQGIPPAHFDFLSACPKYYETERHIFIHANYAAELPLEEQPDYLLLWESLRRHLPGPHYSGKTVVVGHTSQKTGEILDLDYLKCIDTWCYGEGWLTALNVFSGKQWQADKGGSLRR
jgi:serine/threonine protein phosphatase 1